MNALSFHFPSCTDCNTQMKYLEDNAAPVIIKLSKLNTALSSIEIIYLLDWFDKIRIGLWIAFYYLDSEIYEFGPHFHITPRIGTKDRMLGFYYLDKTTDGYSFYNAQSPVFRIFPSWIGFRIFNMIFISGSYDFLLSKNTGYPFPKDWFLLNDPGNFYTENYTLNYPVSPFTGYNFGNDITTIGQAISKYVDSDYLSKIPLHIKNKYIDLYSMQSYPFVILDNTLKYVQNKMNIPIVFKRTNSKPEKIIDALTVQIANFQLKSFDLYNKYNIWFTRKYFRTFINHKRIIKAQKAYINSIETYIKNHGV